MNAGTYIWNDINTWTEDQVNEAIDYIASDFEDRACAERELNHMGESDLRTLVRNLGW